MSDYTFLADLLYTFQSSPDWIKALILLVPPGFVLGLTGLLLRHRAMIKAVEQKYGKDELFRLLEDVYERIDHLRAATPVPFASAEKPDLEQMPAFWHRSKRPD